MVGSIAGNRSLGGCEWAFLSRSKFRALIPYRGSIGNPVLNQRMGSSGYVPPRGFLYFLPVGSALAGGSTSSNSQRWRKCSFEATDSDSSALRHFSMTSSMVIMSFLDVRPTIAGHRPREYGPASSRMGKGAAHQVDTPIPRLPRGTVILLTVLTPFHQGNAPPPHDSAPRQARHGEGEKVN